MRDTLAARFGFHIGFLLTRLTYALHLSAVQMRSKAGTKVKTKGKPKVKRTGRGGAPNKTRLGQVRFSEGLWRTLKREAATKESSISALIRTLCIEGLQRRGWFGGTVRDNI
jgi:hypothetical protein